MADIESSIEYVLENEGGYAEPPLVDQPTKYGVIAADIAKFRNCPIETVSVQDIKDLTKLEATEIYRTQYFDVIQGNKIADQKIATCIFDTAVNRGVQVSVKYTQRALNMSGGNLSVDGIMGSKTLFLLNQVYRPTFIKRFESFEWSGYLAILAEHPEDEKYRNGWMERANKLLTLI